MMKLGVHSVGTRIGRVANSVLELPAFSSVSPAYSEGNMLRMKGIAAAPASLLVTKTDSLTVALPSPFLPSTERFRSKSTL